ncbi:MAG TPA: hemolysin family protein, partial [Aggregatilineales bacterium]|nr:hemolysin family protein [Aggregatilineales bacterium]
RVGLYWTGGMTAPLSGGEIILRLLFLVVLVGLNAFFVMVEYAIVVSRRARIDQMTVSGSPGAKTVQGWLSDPKQRERLIAASQLGVTIVSLALGDQGERTFDLILSPLFANAQVGQVLGGLIHALPLVLSLLIISSIHVVMGEQVPKVAALRNPESTIVRLSLPMRLFVGAAAPLVWLLDRTANDVLRLLGLGSAASHSLLYTVDDLRQIMRESEETGVIAEQEHDMLAAVFDFRDIVTRQVMVPRTEIIMVEADAPITALLEQTIRLPHTKIPVYEGDFDHVIGVVYTKELVKMLAEGNLDREREVRTLMRDVLLVPETLPVEHLLSRMRARHQQMAIVLDEFGGTAGMVTLEDILEEIVGDLRDEFENAEPPPIQHLQGGLTSVEGLMQIAEFNEQFDTHIVDENYDTIGGFIMGQLGRIPVVGDSVTIDGTTLQVEAMDNLRIDRVTVVPAKPAPAAPDENAPITAGQDR